MSWKKSNLKPKKSGLDHKKQTKHKSKKTKQAYHKPPTVLFLFTKRCETKSIMKNQRKRRTGPPIHRKGGVLLEILSSLWTIITNPVVLIALGIGFVCAKFKINPR